MPRIVALQQAIARRHRIRMARLYQLGGERIGTPATDALLRAQNRAIRILRLDR